MRAEAERQMAVGVAVDAEVLRVAEHRLVEVGRLEQQQHLLPLPKLGAVELVVAHHRPGHILHRRGPAQHLLHRAGQQSAVGDQPVPLIGVPEKLLGPATEGVTGGLVTADEDQQRLEDDLVI